MRVLSSPRDMFCEGRHFQSTSVSHNVSNPQASMFEEKIEGFLPSVGAASPEWPLLEWHLAEEHYRDRLWIDPAEILFLEHGSSHARDRMMFHEVSASRRISDDVPRGISEPPDIR